MRIKTRYNNIDMSIGRKYITIEKVNACDVVIEKKQYLIDENLQKMIADYKNDEYLNDPSFICAVYDYCIEKYE